MANDTDTATLNDTLSSARNAARMTEYRIAQGVAPAINQANLAKIVILVTEAEAALTALLAAGLGLPCPTATLTGAVCTGRTEASRTGGHVECDDCGEHYVVIQVAGEAAELARIVACCDCGCFECDDSTEAGSDDKVRCEGCAEHYEDRSAREDYLDQRAEARFEARYEAGL